MAKPIAVLYMGTNNDPRFMRNAKKILIKRGFNVKLVRWNTGRKKSKAYLDVNAWNVQSGNFDIAVGHSAGGFPLQKTAANVTIGINPFITTYNLLDYVLHAISDWLVVKDIPKTKPRRELFLYSGVHSTFPTGAFNKLLDQLA